MNRMIYMEAYPMMSKQNSRRLDTAFQSVAAAAPAAAVALAVLPVLWQDAPGFAFVAAALLGWGGWASIGDQARRRELDNEDERAQALTRLSSHLSRQFALAFGLALLFGGMAAGYGLSWPLVAMIAALTWSDQLIRRYLGLASDERDGELRVRERRTTAFILAVGGAALAFVIFRVIDHIRVSFALSWPELWRLLSVGGA